MSNDDLSYTVNNVVEAIEHFWQISFKGSEYLIRDLNDCLNLNHR